MLDINSTAQEITNSDRSTFFIFNHETNALESYIAQGLPTKIHIALGEGIVGSCAQLKKVIIENDVDTTKEFNAEIDLGSGYVTKNTLTAPILDESNNLLGVIQVLNRADGNYDETDEQLLVKSHGFTCRAAVMAESAGCHVSIISCSSSSLSNIFIHK